MIGIFVHNASIMIGIFVHNEIIMIGIFVHNEIIMIGILYTMKVTYKQKMSPVLLLINKYKRVSNLNYAYFYVNILESPFSKFLIDFVFLF